VRVGGGAPLLPAHGTTLNATDPARFAEGSDMTEVEEAKALVSQLGWRRPRPERLETEPEPSAASGPIG